MATCTYSFQTAQGPITIKGQAEFKAYLASQGVESILPDEAVDEIARVEQNGGYGLTSSDIRKLPDAERSAFAEAIEAAFRLRGAKGSVLGLSISREFEAKGFTSLIGKQISGPEDLAIASQVYRDPRFETIHYVFLQYGEVVGHRAVSSQMAGFSYVVPSAYKDLESYWTELAEQASSLGEGVSIALLHNHPSGDPTPSEADFRLTERAKSFFGGRSIPLFGHVIINHQKYALIDKDIDAFVRNLEFQDTYNSNNPSAPHALLGKAITSQQDLAEHFRASRVSEDNILLLGANGLSGVSLVMEIEPSDLGDAKLGALLRKVSRETGSDTFFAVNVPERMLARAQAAYRKGFFVDVIMREAYGQKSFSLNAAGTSRMSGYRMGRASEATSEVQQPQALFSNRRQVDTPEFSNQVDAALRGELSAPLSLGATPPSLVAAGLPDVELKIAQSVVDKILYDHGLPVRTIKALPSLLADPVMVFASDTQPGSFVIQLDESKESEPVIVSVKANGTIERVGPVNIITSAYAKKTGVISSWITKGLLLAANMKKALAFVTTNRLQLPAVVQQMNKSSVVKLPETPSEVNTRYSNRRKPGSGSKFALPEESAYDAKVRTWQNDQVRWKRQMAAVRDRGGVVNEQNDAYQAMERMIARAMNRTEDFYAKTVTPILKEMKDASITIDDLGQYLYARHAKERNAYIAEINPAFANTAYDEVGGSGMSDQEADEIIARIQADPQAADFDRFAEAFRGWAEANLDGLVQGGLLSQEQADSMRERFPNYVPLRGFEAGDDEAGIFGQGAGFSTGKRLFQRTLGRRTKADNPASYIIHQVAEGMLAREKANVGRYLERLVADNPDDKLWTIGEPDKEPVMGYAPLRYKLMLDSKEVDTFNTKTQAQQYKQLMNLKGATIEETGGEPQVMQRDLGYDPEKEVRFIRDGKQVRIQLKDPLLARAYNNGGAAEMGVLLQASASINAFLREMWTQKNPVFPLVNMLRDVPSAMLYAAGEMPGLATSMPKYLPGAWKAMYSQAKGEKIEGEWGPWVTEYRKAGGGIGFRMVGDIQSTMDRINRIEKKLGRESVLEALQAGNLKDATKRILWRTYNNAVTDFIERINQAFENMSRLAIYRASREQGASVAEASRMAKNATVNFNRRGEMTNNINSLYLFANAAIQDLAKNKRSVMDAPGKAKVGAALAGVASLGMMLGFFADDDDDLIDENMNVNAIRLTVGDKTVSLPLSYGLIGFAHYLGRSIAKVAKGEDIGMQSLRLASALLSNALPINPIPNPDKVDVANTVIGVAPTAIEFPLQVALNRNAFGSMMMPDYNNDPDAYKTFRGTRGTIYADVAAFLNESTGGDKRQSGWIDISPETLKGIVHFTFGGTGKFVADSYTSTTNLLGGSSTLQNSVPVLNRFVKQNDATVYRARFYRQAMEAKDKLELYNEYRKDGDMAKAREFSRWVSVGRTGNKLWKQMNALRDQELKAKDQLTGAALDARLRELDEKQVALSNRFFEIYKKAAAPKSAPSR